MGESPAVAPLRLRYTLAGLNGNSYESGRISFQRTIFRRRAQCPFPPPSSFSLNAASVATNAVHSFISSLLAFVHPNPTHRRARTRRTPFPIPGEWINVYGKKRRLRTRADIEQFMLANDLEDVEIGVWGQHISVHHPFWSPDYDHPAQQLNPPPPPLPPPLRADLVGRSVRAKFPGYGWYNGTIVGVNDASTKYVVAFEGCPGEEEYAPKKVRKILQPAA